MRTRAHLILALSLSLVTLPAFALPGEASAVLEQCGAPTSQSSNVLPTNSRDERTLTYGNLTMHFEPLQGRWSFTNAFRGEESVSRSQLAAQMPCFHKALGEAAAQPVFGTSSLTSATSPGPFGIPHFYLIGFLVLSLIVFGFWPRKGDQAHDPVPANKPYRRPVIQPRRPLIQ
ncbi:MAG: hypothetical protein V4555_01185 [Acidobacteriota bacterium]